MLISHKVFYIPSATTITKLLVFQPQTDVPWSVESHPLHHNCINILGTHAWVPQPYGQVSGLLQEYNATVVEVPVVRGAASILH